MGKDPNPEGRAGRGGRKPNNPTLHPEVFQDFCKRTTWCDVFCAPRQRCLLLSPSVFYHACAP